MLYPIELQVRSKKNFIPGFAVKIKVKIFKPKNRLLCGAGSVMLCGAAAVGGIRLFWILNIVISRVAIFVAD